MWPFPLVRLGGRGAVEEARAHSFPPNLEQRARSLSLSRVLRSHFFPATAVPLSAEGQVALASVAGAAPLADMLRYHLSDATVCALACTVAANIVQTSLCSPP